MHSTQPGRPATARGLASSGARKDEERPALAALIGPVFRWQRDLLDRSMDVDRLEFVPARPDRAFQRLTRSLAEVFETLAPFARILAENERRAGSALLARHRRRRHR